MSAPIFLPPSLRLDPARLALIGAGPLARAVARVALQAGGTKARVWTRRPEGATALAGEVPGLEAAPSPEAALDGAGTVLFAVPAGELAEAAESIAPHALPDMVAIVASRGVTSGFTLPHTHVRTTTCLRKIGVLGGPLHARELEAGRRVNAVIAYRFPEVLDRLNALTAGSPIFFHPSSDLIGVEVAGAIANVAALAAGVAIGLELGDTARGVLLARGVVESRRLGVRLGALAETFSGLAGLGELIPRSVTSVDRHVAVGRALAAKTPLSEALASAGGHVEGLETAREALARATVFRLELPLVTAVVEIAEGRADPREAIESVLARPLPLDRA